MPDSPVSFQSTNYIINDRRQILKRVNVNPNLTIRHKIVKLLEENVGENLWDIDLGKMFLDMTPNAQPTKEKQNQQMELYQN